MGKSEIINRLGKKCFCCPVQTAACSHGNPVTSLARHGIKYPNVWMLLSGSTGSKQEYKFCTVWWAILRIGKTEQYLECPAS